MPQSILAQAPGAISGLPDMAVVKTKVLEVIQGSQEFSECHAGSLQVHPSAPDKARAYAWFKWEGGELKRQAHRPYTSPDFCTKEGRAGNSIHLAELTEEFTQSPMLQACLAKFSKSVELMNGQPLEEEIEANVVRTRCQRKPTEVSRKRHQDGFKFVGLVALERDNVQGAKNFMAKEKDGTPFFEDFLEVGDCLIFDDAELWHWVTDLEVSDPLRGPGYRSMLILSAGRRCLA